MDEFEMKKYCEFDNKDNYYLYPGTDVLKNKYDIKTNNKLDKYEKIICSIELMDMQKNPFCCDFDYNHYLKIHKKLFGKLYFFAGEIRKIDTLKPNTYFCRKEFVSKNLHSTLIEMKEKLTNVTNEEEYVYLLSKYYLDLNFIHPFREGNGRTLREFIRQYVEYLNKVIDIGEYKFVISNFDKDNLLKHTISDDVYKVEEEFKKAVVKTKEKTR